MFKKRFDQPLHTFIFITTLVAISSLSALFFVDRTPTTLAVAFGGMVSKYQPVCVLDTPANAPTTCAVSCPLCTGFLGSGCQSVSEIQFTGVGAPVVCPTQGFKYLGGGFPRAGGYILGTGVPQAPTLIGTN